MTRSTQSYGVDEVMGEGVSACPKIEEVFCTRVNDANAVVFQLDVDDSSRELAFLRRVANDHVALTDNDASTPT